MSFARTTNFFLPIQRYVAGNLLARDWSHSSTVEEVEATGPEGSADQRQKDKF